MTKIKQLILIKINKLKKLDYKNNHVIGMQMDCLHRMLDEIERFKKLERELNES